MTTLTVLPRDTNLHADKLRYHAWSTAHFDGFFILAQSGDPILAQSGDSIYSYGYERTINYMTLHAPEKDLAMRTPSS